MASAFMTGEFRNSKIYYTVMFLCVVMVFTCHGLHASSVKLHATGMKDERQFSGVLFFTFLHSFLSQKQFICYCIWLKAPISYCYNFTISTLFKSIYCIFCFCIFKVISILRRSDLQIDSYFGVVSENCLSIKKEQSFNLEIF